MKYVIVSPKIGKPGAPYVPADGVNVLALIAGGFIKAAPKPEKPAKLEPEQDKE